MHYHLLMHHRTELSKYHISFHITSGYGYVGVSYYYLVCVSLVCYYKPPKIQPLSWALAKIHLSAVSRVYFIQIFLYFHFSSLTTFLESYADGFNLPSRSNLLWWVTGNCSYTMCYRIYPFPVHLAKFGFLCLCTL